MSAFEKLRELLEEDIESYSYRINSIDQKVNARAELEKIINLVRSKKNVHLSQVKRMGVYFPELEEYILLLQEIETIILSIKKGHYRGILPDRIRLILTKGDIPSVEIASVMDDFILCEKLNSYINSSDSDDRVKNIVLDAYKNLYSHLYRTFQFVFSGLINAIQEKYDNFGKVDTLLDQKKDLMDYLSKIKRIKFLFNNDGMVSDFDSEEDKLFFFSWIKGRLSIDTEEEITDNISKFQNGVNQKSDEEISLENRRRIIDKISGIILLKEMVLFDGIDLSQFSIEEQQIIQKVKDIYIEMCQKCFERIVFSPSELANRQEAYFYDKLEWGVVLADIENNLVPNINSDRENVINIFKYIIEIYDGQKEQTVDSSFLRNQVEAIKSFIHDLEEILKIDDLYNTTYDYLFDEDVECDDPRYNGKYEYYAIRYFLRREVEPFKHELEDILLDISAKLESGTVTYSQNDLSRIEELKKRFTNIMRKYIEIYEKYQEFLERDYEEAVESDEKTNLVFCLDTIDFFDTFGNYDEGKRKELIDAINRLETVPLGDLRRPFGRKAVSDILYRPGTKNKRRKGQLHLSMVSFDNPYFEPYRYSGSGNYRTGFIRFPICQENKEKLEQIYHLGNEFSVFAIFKIISTVSDNHDEYQLFVNYIRDNKVYLETLGKMFLNPSIDIQKLCEIIDHGINLQKDLTNGNILI